MSPTHLAADGQQGVQDYDGGDGGHSRHLGVVADDGPKREDQDRARDHDGDEDQRPPQPVKWNDPQDLEVEKKGGRGADVERCFWSPGGGCSAAGNGSRREKPQHPRGRSGLTEVGM